MDSYDDCRSAEGPPAEEFPALDIGVKQTELLLVAAHLSCGVILNRSSDFAPICHHSCDNASDVLIGTFCTRSNLKAIYTVKK